jgi:hypothetical protein
LICRPLRTDAVKQRLQLSFSKQQRFTVT